VARCFFDGDGLDGGPSAVADTDPVADAKPAGLHPPVDGEERVVGCRAEGKTVTPELMGLRNRMGR